MIKKIGTSLHLLALVSKHFWVNGTTHSINVKTYVKRILGARGVENHSNRNGFRFRLHFPIYKIIHLNNNKLNK